MEYKEIKLEVLTPVHIGTGESLDPFSYVMKEEKGEIWFHTVDLPAWVESRADQEKLLSIFDGSNFIATRSYVYENLDPDLYGISKSKVSRKVYQEYEKKINRGPEEQKNALKVSPAMRNPLNQSPYIPGSSIKGAIRTAVIDYLDKKREANPRQKIIKDSGNYQKVLQEVLGTIGNNSFKNLMVTDLEGKQENCRYVSAEEVRKKPSEENTPKDPCEVVSGLAMGEGASVFFGRMGIGRKKDGGKSLVIEPSGESLTLQALMNICNDFYIQRFEKEKEDFYTKSHLSETFQALSAIEKEILNPRPGEMVLRVGRYSHIECMTVTNNKPEPPKEKGVPKPYGTTRTLAEGIYPFGWVKITLCSKEEYARHFREKEALDLKERELEKEKKEKQLQIKEEALKEWKRQEEEREERRVNKEKAEQERLQMEALPLEERFPLQLKSGSMGDDEIGKIFTELDGFSPEGREKCALALKEYWRKKRVWDKGGSKKLRKKVEKVKAILEENR